ncbi:MAG: hypothetical protein SPK85_02925 [Prevotella sp.]|nr:hypothetical protein [Prevotella sp.]
MKTNNQRKPYIKPVCEHFFYPMESHLLSNSYIEIDKSPTGDNTFDGEFSARGNYMGYESYANGYKRKSLWDD